jgi:hypothetical protein
MPYTPQSGGAPTQILIAGVQATPLVRISNLTISDVLNEQPNTAALTVAQLPHLAPSAPFHPPSFHATAFVTTPTSITYPAIRRGQPIAITSSGATIFAGEIVTVQQFYELQRPNEPTHVAYHLQCTDHTRALNRRKVTKSYLTQSATAIVQDLIASFTSGFSAAAVAPNLPAVAIDFTFEELNRALTRLANRIGGYWYVDYDRILHFFITEAGDAPTPLGPGVAFSDLTFETDLSQVRTRVIVEGAGTTVTSRINLGETMIPVRDPQMFPASGGVVRIEQAQISYTGVIAGGSGALGGPGAAPGVAPTAAPLAGAGVTPGQHGYAVTWTTASGESLPSPQALVTVGRIDPPATAPAPQPPTAGSGPSPGTHYYAVTFVTPVGETTPGVTSTPVVTTQVVGLPTPGASSAVLAGVVGNLANGSNYRYVTTITTAGGETLPGAASAAITVTPPARPPGSPADYANLETGGALAAGVYYYAVAFTVGGFETGLSDYVIPTLDPPATSAVRLVNLVVSGDARITGRKLYRSKVNNADNRLYLIATVANNLAGQAYLDTANDTALTGPSRPFNDSATVGTPPGNQGRVTIPTSADARAVGRKVYRSDNGAAFRYLATVNNTTATEYLDNVTSVASNADAPTVDTTGGALTCVVELQAIPVGPASVTARRIYRTPANAGLGVMRLVATIGNNTQTGYVDTLTDAGLGAAPPATNTTTAERVALSNLQVGAAGVTGRKVYRTAANTTTPLKLLTTIADNVTTVYTDAAADATLGASAPIVDTSGLQQPQGQVTAGAAVLPVAGTAAFAPTGGFAVVGNGEQVIRYTGVTATSLTGIPPTGPGALTATVAYNASVTVAPTLTGIPASGPGALTRALIPGQDVNLLTTRDDVAAQTALAAIEGGDGIIEHYIQDRRMSPSGALATAQAELDLFAAPEVRVRYTTRDPATRSGKAIAIDLPAPTSLAGTFQIQRVQLTQFDLPGVAPLRTVEASSTRFSFEDVLRRLELEVEA